MNKIKTIFPILVGLILMVGLSVTNNQNAEAQGGPNCYINDVDYICRTTASVDCLCIDKPSPSPPSGEPQHEGDN